MSVSTPCNSWRSRPFVAVVSESLCVELLLGIPFLAHNKIVMDHEFRTAIAKDSGIDILNPSPKPAPLKPLSTAQKLKAWNNHRKAFWQELTATISHRAANYISPVTTKENIPWRSLFASQFAAAIKRVSEAENIAQISKSLSDEFKDLFEPIPHTSRLPTDIYAEIKLKDPAKTIATKVYSSPRALKDAWETIITENVKAGRIRRSDSVYASPSFLIPKADKTALPRWVCDFRQLNENTVPDRFPLPKVDDILAECGNARYWAKFDMTNSFFQTLVHPDHVKYTAVTTPYHGLWEWVAMPMGIRNAPAIHQRRIVKALAHVLGKFCFVYLDDIIVKSQTPEEHIRNCQKVLAALRDAQIKLNPKKCIFCCTELDFLGHHITRDGIRPDGAKVDKIANWPVPQSSTDVRKFLGLVRYLSQFLKGFTEHSEVLEQLTTKDCDKIFPSWTLAHQRAFDAIKSLVLSSDVLTTIDHDNPGDSNIYVTCDASDRRSGACLSFGPSWETSRPVAFESRTFKHAELRYPVHEKELLAIMRALKHWRSDLIGVHFYVYTDHRTLTNFHTQRDLSPRQSRWMEFLSQYDCTIVYVKGEDNTVADALSRVEFTKDSIKAQDRARHILGHVNDAMPYSTDPADPADCVTVVLPAEPLCVLVPAKGTPKRLAYIARFCPDMTPDPVYDVVAATSATVSVSFNAEFLQDIKSGYEQCPWSQKLISASPGMPNITKRDGIWLIDDRVMVPDFNNVRGRLFALAHDSLGHYGFAKTYSTLRNDFYWPGMRHDLENSYIPSCPDCQRNKSRTSKPAGPLHPLPVPSARCESIAMDFVGKLPLDDGFDTILTITDRLGSDIRLIPCHSSNSAEQIARLFFSSWFCENGLPSDIVSDRDKLFMSAFWTALHTLTGVRLKPSTAFHPETDGSSERTNKTMIQALRFHVERNQRGWASKLPLIRFHLMSTVNTSTGYSPFQLRFGRSPRLIPPLLGLPPDAPRAEVNAWDIVRHMEILTAEARDNLTAAKVDQAHFANAHRLPDPELKLGDLVALSTENRRRDYKTTGQDRTAKLMPRFDGPYRIIAMNPKASTFTLDLPPHTNIHPTFHVSQLRVWKDNDDAEYPDRAFAEPGPILTKDGYEHVVDRILDERNRGRGKQYYVRWIGYGPNHDEWIARSKLLENEALDVWENRVQPSSSTSAGR